MNNEFTPNNRRSFVDNLHKILVYGNVNLLQKAALNEIILIFYRFYIGASNSVDYCRIGNLIWQKILPGSDSDLNYLSKLFSVDVASYVSTIRRKPIVRPASLATRDRLFELLLIISDGGEELPEIASLGLIELIGLAIWLCYDSSILVDLNEYIYERVNCSKGSDVTASSYALNLRSAVYNDLIEVQARRMKY